jgi:hypothetical protein
VGIRRLRGAFGLTECVDLMSFCHNWAAARLDISFRHDGCGFDSSNVYKICVFSLLKNKGIWLRSFALPIEVQVKNSSAPLPITRCNRSLGGPRSNKLARL